MKKLIIFFLLVASVGMAKGQTEGLAKYKSMFTLNFIRYVGWPADVKQGDFVIGVLKSSKMAQELKAQTGTKKFGYQNIVVKEFNSIEEVVNCQILYVGTSINYGKHSSAISAKLNNKNSLIITESNGSISKGAMINFVAVDNKLKFEVSSNNAAKYGLSFSSSLLALNNAIRV